MSLKRSRSDKASNLFLDKTYVEWYKDGKILGGGTSTLFISRFNKEHLGLYTCIAVKTTNKGEKETAVDIEFEYKYDNVYQGVFKAKDTHSIIVMHGDISQHTTSITSTTEQTTTTTAKTFRTRSVTSSRTSFSQTKADEYELNDDYGSLTLKFSPGFTSILKQHERFEVNCSSLGEHFDIYLHFNLFLF